MNPPDNETLDLQRDILSGRTFSMAEVIGREGTSFMKGESPVPRLVQVLTEINLFIQQHLVDISGIVQAILFAWVKSDEARVSRYVKSPLVALQEIVENITTDADTLYEFVRQVDCKWGQMNNERPYFQKPGQPPHPDDEFTHESVQIQLSQFLSVLKCHL
ncbi:MULTISPECIES: hypothetical protein [unclassified Leptolyngbya]|uniref:hypothetical protein n=1 Tax=unclassified Leptolyngbya TaxID=2650499 RepID=UPI001685FEE0|nr:MULTISPECIES: hypothetical protein [unclassified Leptolyngbya]MBD1913870.1 hypothetical protein [Leptolyngbya sp. FACHB-8]MBD2157380.1 hypothetical protein [Leptolyngbya sp. FACHB-16]